MQATYFVSALSLTKMVFFSHFKNNLPSKWPCWLLLGAWVVLFATCRRPLEDGTELPLPTQICVKTQHHNVLVRECNVFVKFNTDTFPGYDHPAEFFDTVFVTGADARGCLLQVPEGHHWLVAFGVDDSHYPLPVFGSLPVRVSFEKPTVDTLLYVSEVH